MRNWLRGRRKDSSGPASTAGQREADKALDKETQKLRTAEGQTDEILAAAETLKRLGEQNDFAVRLRRAMGGAG